MLPHIVTALDILNVSTPTSLPSRLSYLPTLPQDHDNEDGIKSLHVPAWDDKTKIQSTPHTTNHDISFTWSDSLLDGASDHSSSPSGYPSKTREIGNSIIGGQQPQRPRGRRQSKEQLKRKHQVQADLLVEKTFIQQLRQSEDDYTHMRTYYENQLLTLQDQLIDMRYQRDHALGDIEIYDRKRKKNNLNTNIQHRRQQQSSPHHVTRHVRQQHATSSQPVPQKPLAQHIKEIRLHYESQLQRLSRENKEWERKHSQTVHTMTTNRTHVDQVVTRLHSKIQQLQTERNQLEQSMKRDNARLMKQLSLANQEIQQLKKSREVTTPTFTPKQQKDSNHRDLTLKTKNQQYVQHINKILRKAAADGVLLSDAFTLEKVVHAKLPLPPTRLQHSPPPSPTALH